jgi:RNA polymerase subunit RPABC4/transcription elongation factor Spt4
MNISMLKRSAVTPFVECPNCERLVEFGTEMCPDCREEIGDEYAAVSAAIIFHNTQACSSANTIKSGDPGALIILGASAYAFFISAPALFITCAASPVLFLIVISIWFFRFGGFQYGDEEFVRARNDMKASLKLWAALLAVQALALLHLLDASQRA